MLYPKRPESKIYGSDAVVCASDIAMVTSKLAELKRRRADDGMIKECDLYIRIGPIATERNAGAYVKLVQIEGCTRAPEFNAPEVEAEHVGGRSLREQQIVQHDVGNINFSRTLNPTSRLPELN